MRPPTLPSQLCPAAQTPSVRLLLLLQRHHLRQTPGLFPSGWRAAGDRDRDRDPITRGCPQAAADPSPPHRTSLSRQPRGSSVVPEFPLPRPQFQIHPSPVPDGAGEREEGKQKRRWFSLQADNHFPGYWGRRIPHSFALHGCVPLLPAEDWELRDTHTCSSQSKLCRDRHGPRQGGKASK